MRFLVSLSFDGLTSLNPGDQVEYEDCLETIKSIHLSERGVLDSVQTQITITLQSGRSFTKTQYQHRLVRALASF